MINGASILAEREILYFFRMDGCAACSLAEPELARFMAKNPTMTVLTFSAAGPYPEQLGVKIRATPTYALRLGDRMFKTEGALKLSDLERWIKKVRAQA